MPIQSVALREQYLEYLASRGLDLAAADARPENWPNPFKADGAFDPERASQLIRFLESSRRYVHWSDVARERVANYLYRLGTVATQRGPYLGDTLPALQKVVDQHLEALGRALDESNVHLPFPVYVGVCPTGEFNARVRPVAGGALILVSAGLMDLIFTILKINLATSGDVSDPPPLDDEGASRALTDAFNSFLYGKGSVKAWGLPRLDPHREHLLDVVLQAAESFALAHEIGHLALGHVTLPPGAGGSATVVLTPETEMSADDFAVALLLHPHVGPFRDPAIGDFATGGFLTSLVIAQTLALLRSALGIPAPPDDSHPALAQRLPHLAETLERRLIGINPLRQASTFAGWLCAYHLPHVQEWFQKIDQTVRRSWEYDLIPGVR